MWRKQKKKKKEPNKQAQSRYKTAFIQTIILSGICLCNFQQTGTVRSFSKFLLILCKFLLYSDAKTHKCWLANKCWCKASDRELNNMNIQSQNVSLKNKLLVFNNVTENGFWYIIKKFWCILLLVILNSARKGLTKLTVIKHFCVDAKAPWSWG